MLDGLSSSVALIIQQSNTTKALKKTADALQEKSSELERYAYTISHDLKSPLVTVQTFLGYLEQDLSKPDVNRVAQDMLYMRAAAGKMGRLLDELLEMSRVGRVVNPPVRVTWRALVEEALAAVAGRLAERGADARVSDEPVVLFGDRARLSEIWQNLIDNAVKFMGDQASPRIEIGTEGHGRDMVFFVRDNGMGIEPRYHAKVFGLFEKLDPKIEGTGMGLALVKRIVELYQGKIWMESEGPGTGTCVRFTLPEAVNPEP
jgi:signal transduction histidine kinase